MVDGIGQADDAPSRRAATHRSASTANDANAAPPKSSAPIKQFARAEAIGQEADRSLRQHRDQVEDRQRQAELDEADAEPDLEQRKERDDGQHVKVRDQVRARDEPHRAPLDRERLVVPDPRPAMGHNRRSHGLTSPVRRVPRTASATLR